MELQKAKDRLRVFEERRTDAMMREARADTGKDTGRDVDRDRDEDNGPER